MSKYGAFSGPYFTVFSPNTGKHVPEKTPYLDTLHAVFVHDCKLVLLLVKWQFNTCLEKNADLQNAVPLIFVNWDYCANNALQKLFRISCCSCEIWHMLNAKLLGFMMCVAHITHTFSYLLFPLGKPMRPCTEHHLKLITVCIHNAKLASLQIAVLILLMSPQYLDLPYY